MALKLNVKLKSKNIISADELFSEAQREAILGVVRAGEEYLELNTPVDRGGLRKSLTPEVDASGDQISVTWATEHPGAQPLNLNARRKKGRRPPIREIERWVKRRGIQPQNSGSTQKDVAWAIAKKIELEGVKGPLRRVEGPKADERTKGWFSGLSAALKPAMADARKEMTARIVRAWNAKHGK
jgi:hypothetical protein